MVGAGSGVRCWEGVWAVFGFQKSLPSENRFLCAGAPAAGWGSCPCLPVHVPWMCLPRRQVPSPAARAGALLPSPLPCLCGPGHSSAPQECPLLPLVSRHRGQDEFLKATHWDNPKMKTLGSPGALSARLDGRRWGVCKGGSVAVPAPGDAPGTLGRCSPLPRRFAWLQPVALRWVHSLPSTQPCW